MQAAFFDMDKTVLRIASGRMWLAFLFRQGYLAPGSLLHVSLWGLLHTLRLIDTRLLTTRICAEFRGLSEQQLKELAHEWYRTTEMRHHVALQAKHEINAHLEHGVVVSILTSSHQYLANAVAEPLGIAHVLANQYEIAGDRFTGRLKQACYGEEKVVLVESFAKKKGIDLTKSWFYTDSFDDLPMLERVGIPVAVNPDRKLRRHALRHGWRIENWLDDTP